MKPFVLAIIVVILPTLILAQGTPSSGNSALWQMRKKVQQRSAQRTGTYLEQMNQALQSGDAEGAETAMKSAIAQGTLTQAQIDDARGRIDSMVSQQRQAMVAAARAKSEGEARAAEAQRAAESDAAARSANASRMASATSSSAATAGKSSADTKPEETDVDRFRKHFRGRDVTCTVLDDDGGGFASSNDLVVRDAGTGKKFRVGYTYGLGKSLGEGKSMVGRSVIIHFSDEGSPRTIKNPANGMLFGIDPEWKASGYGW